MTAETFWSRVDNIGGLFDCWKFTGFVDLRGRGYLYAWGCHQYAHRVAWILTYGAIPTGLKVCHHCDNQGCINPIHLFLGTMADNMHDRDAKGRQAHGLKNGNGRKTHCPRGHEYSAENTQITIAQEGYRERKCRKCDHLRKEWKKTERTVSG